MGGGTTVTITGSGLGDATTVDFGNTPAASFVVESPTQITATSPAGSMGAAGVAVVTAGGVSAITSADQFTYAATTLTWTGSSGGNWTDAQWSGAGPSSPDVTTNAIVDSAVVVQVNSPQAANALAIENEAQLYVAPGASLAITANTSVSGGGILNLAPLDAMSIGGTLAVGVGGIVIGGNVTAAALQLNGGIVAGGIVTAAAFQLNDGIVSANLAGPGGLTKGGAGTATLSGTNTYSGGTTVSSGTLIVTNSAALPNGSSLTVGAGAGNLFGLAAAPTVNAPTTATVAPQAMTAVAAPSAGVFSSCGPRLAVASVLVRDTRFLKAGTFDFAAAEQSAAPGTSRATVHAMALQGAMAQRFAADLTWLQGTPDALTSTVRDDNATSAVQALDAALAAYGEE